ncbi:MAG: hypothetical protein ROO76_07230 [Terriglobia bacterium]|nr:hypothetical protein [Terriglobia bacterium]
MINKRIAVEIAIAAAKNCIHVFEEKYPTDDRPLKALEAAETWLADPTNANHQEIEMIEVRVWRSRDWEGRARSAAEACASAARALRHPQTSAMDAICCESCANGIEFNEDYGRCFLWHLIRSSNRT